MTDFERGTVWLPKGPHHDLNIEHHPLEDAGSFTGGGKKIVPHTTESPAEAVDAMVAVVGAKRAAPHFVFGYRKGYKFPVVVQCVALDQAARTLIHAPGTPETNRANAYQIEICGYTAHTKDWPENYLKGLANLWRMIHLVTGAPLNVPRSFRNPRRYTGSGWYNAKGIVGHCHCPGNFHTDPTGLRAKHISRMADSGWQNLKPR